MNHLLKLIVCTYMVLVLGNININASSLESNVMLEENLLTEDSVETATQTLSHIKRVSYFRVENGKLYIDGYSYVKGINIPNQIDIIQKLKFVDIQTGKQVKTYELPNYYSTAASKDPNHGAGVYNYDWAKFKGYLDISDLPTGDYYIKIYTNAKGNKYDEIIDFHSSIGDFSFEIKGKEYKFLREENTLRLSVVKLNTPELPEVVENPHVKRVSYFRAENNQLYIDGYSYVKGVNIPNQADIIQKLKFVDVTTGKQVKTYELPSYYSTAASKDPNHGGGIYNYDWAKFKGYLNVSDLPIGEYYIKIYTNAKKHVYDEIIAFHSSINSFKFLTEEKSFEFERVTVNNIGTLKLTVKQIQEDKAQVITMHELFDDMITTLGTRYNYRIFNSFSSFEAQSKEWGLTVGSYIYRDSDPDYSIFLDKNVTKEEKDMLKTILSWVFPNEFDKVYNAIDFNFTDSRLETYNVEGIDFTITYRIDEYDKTFQRIGITFLDQEINNYPIRESIRNGSEIINYLVSECGWQFGYDKTVATYDDYNLRLDVTKGPLSGNDVELSVNYNWLSEEGVKQLKNVIHLILPNEGGEMIQYMESDAFWESYDPKSYEFDDRIIGQYFLNNSYQLIFSGIMN